MAGEAVSGRRVLAIEGAERLTFLQGLVSNDVSRLDSGLVYAALLSPQGKYLADFFLRQDGERVLLDVAEELADDLIKRLTMYRLRAAVKIEPTALHVVRGLGPAPEGALPDPRDPSLGWRLYAAEPGGPEITDWDAIRVAAGVPEAGSELIPGDTYILEAGFDRVHGVDFHKGCYVGQEVTARMKHKTELRKGLALVGVTGPAEAGTEILAEGRAAGRITTRAGDRALAWLRFDRARAEMTAGDATVTWAG
ncbi:folate-binding protein YgfZ [Tropicimonas sp. IMCC34043]|uniref:CAF17-like 4Fe-4S cluster assembly/insertion protein YgfZ n=1 Tax=Tropicimonas sp. IMCC34043 TaxID=2248760 RepID=UPI000E26088F|nr:folate-binding protein YgfZ [Tropicimonas sp. IMCC34043]